MTSRPRDHHKLRHCFLSPWFVKFTSMIYVDIEISRCLDFEHYYNLGRTI